MKHITLKIIDCVCESLINQIDKTPYYGLVTGEVGFAYLCAQLYQNTGREHYFEWNQKCIKSLYAKDSFTQNLSLGYGKAGTTWLLSRLQRMELLLDAESTIECNIEILRKQCKQMILENDFDYFKGALGLLYSLYDMGRLDQELVSDFCTKIDEKYSANNPNRLDYKPVAFEDSKEIDSINLGVPHGLNGLVLFILMLKEDGFQNTDSSIKILLDLFLFVYKNKIKGASSFPTFIHRNDNRSSRSSLSWCYGDLYIIYAFKKGGLLLREPKYENFAAELLSNTIHRRDFRPDNLTVCHGVNSIAFSFQKLYDLFKTPALKQVSEMWQKQSLSVLNSLYKNFEELDTHNDIFDDPSFINGFPGAALYFLDLKGTIKVDWNFLLIK